ncbi:MAG: glycosyltransferase family 9 protein, partial [Chloroflexi bacterium]|nr:glycosyltransferase family 9 protein [Chloroflexota bacterium]
MTKRILVVKLSDIGDVLTATPALRALRQTFADARIDALVPPRSAPVLRGSPLLDELIVFDKFAYDRPGGALAPGALGAALRFGLQLRARRYDTLALLHHLSTRWGALKWAALALAVGAPTRAGLDNGRGWFLTHRVPDSGFGARHEVAYNLAVVSAVGAATGDTRLAMPVCDDDIAAAEHLLNHSRGGPSIILHPGSGGHSLARRWPPERWVSLGRALAGRYEARIVIVGTRDDGGHELAAQLPDALDLTDRTSLGQLGALMRRGNLFVGADSGVMHIAAASGIPLVALFGTTNPKAWGPWRPDAEMGSTPFDTLRQPPIQSGVRLRVLGSPSMARCVVVQSSTPGCPCAYVGFQIRSAECEARRCMEGISVEGV